MRKCKYPLLSIYLQFNGSGQVRTKFVPCSFQVRSLRNEQITKMGRIWKGRLVRIFPLHRACLAFALLQSGCSNAAVRLQQCCKGTAVTLQSGCSVFAVRRRGWVIGGKGGCCSTADRYRQRHTLIYLPVPQIAFYFLSGNFLLSLHSTSQWLYYPSHQPIGIHRIPGPE